MVLLPVGDDPWCGSDHCQLTLSPDWCHMLGQATELRQGVIAVFSSATCAPKAAMGARGVSHAAPCVEPNGTRRCCAPDGAAGADRHGLSQGRCSAAPCVHAALCTLLSAHPSLQTPNPHGF